MQLAARRRVQIAAMPALVGGATFMGLSSDRPPAGSVMLVSLAVLILAFVGGDLLRNVLVVDLQPWRALWITAVLANASLGVLVIRLHQRGHSVIYLAGAAVLSALSVHFPMVKPVAPLATLLASIILFIGLRLSGPLRGAPRFAALFLFGLAGAFSLLAAQFDLGHPTTAVPELAETAVAAFAVAALVVLLRRGPNWVLVVASAAALTASIAMADARTPWERYAASTAAAPSLRAFVPQTGSVYWEGVDGLDMLWFKLRRPDCYGCLHAGGIIFFRKTALDYARRQHALRSLSTDDFDDVAGTVCGAKAQPDALGPANAAQIADACRALPDLDTLILTGLVPGTMARSWTAPVPETCYSANRQRRRVSKFYRYDCASFR